MNRIKYILTLVFAVISLTASAQYTVKVLQIMDEETAIANYILPADVDSITFGKRYFYDVLISSSDSDKGYVSHSQDYLEEGETTSFWAEGINGYVFDYWTLNGEFFSKERNPIDIPITQDSEFIAYFKPDPYAGRSSEAIDLGLPSGTQWSSCNVGGSQKQAHGRRYFWGGIVEKGSGDVQDTYTDNPDVLPLSADAANAFLGGEWCMPTKDDWEELIAYCNWSVDFSSDDKGLVGVSKVNAVEIWIPFTYYPGTISYDIDENGVIHTRYWTSSIGEIKTNAIVFHITADHNTVQFINILSEEVSRASSWYPIRAVIKVEK